MEFRVPVEMVVDVEDGVVDQVAAHIRAGERIKGVQLLRKWYGLGLREAVSVTDAIGPSPRGVRFNGTVSLADLRRSANDAAAEASNAVYAAACAVFEQGELARIFRGNGHHMAQRVAEFAAGLARERWQESAPTGAGEG